MSRRPLVACLVTTAAGALMGALLGAIVGRVIALFGDQTVQASVPMVFCGTLGYFVGGASAAKGSLERFGATHAGLGATVAGAVLVILVGGASLGRTSGPLIAVVALAAIALAAVAATAIGRPQEAPVKTAAVAAPRPPKAPKAPRQARKARTAKVDDEADLSDLFAEDVNGGDDNGDDDSGAETITSVRAAPEAHKPRATTAARRVPTVVADPEPAEEPDDSEDWEPETEARSTFAEDLEDWQPEEDDAEEDEAQADEDDVEEEPEPEPQPRGRRAAPLRARPAQPPTEAPPEPPATSAPRPRRDRPLRKGDA